MRRIALLFCASLAGCFSEPEASGDTDACALGSMGCDCYGNATCDAGLRCEESILTCIPENCVAGTTGCECDAGACNAGLICAPPGVCETASASSSTSSGTAMPGTEVTTDITTSNDSTTGDNTTDESASAVTTEGPVVEQDIILYLTRQDYEGLPGPMPLNLMPTKGLVARDHADGLCEQSAVDFAAVAACDTWTAILSIDGDDTILNLEIPPGQVFAATDPMQPIASSFSSFVEEGPFNGQSLSGVGLRPSDSTDMFPGLFWTGSDAIGNVGDTCMTWQSNSPSEEGTFAGMDASGPGWLSTSTNGCNADFPLLCACWAASAP